MKHLLSLGAVGLLASAAAAQSGVPLPLSLDPTFDPNLQPGVSGANSARATVACDDFNRAVLGPEWVDLGGTPGIFNDGYGSTSGNCYSEYQNASGAYDTISIRIDLPDNPVGLSYGAAVVGLGGAQNLYTKVQGSGSYTNIGAYVGFNGGGSGGYGGFFAITAVTGGWADFYIDPNSGGDIMVVDIDENRDGVVDYTYTYPGILAAFPAGTFGTGIGVGAFSSAFASADSWEVNGGCAPQGPQAQIVGQCGMAGSGVQGLNMTPNAPVGFAFSPNMGALVLPGGPCGPVQTSLGGPVFVLGVILADGTGTATLLPGNGIPAQGCGGYVQLLDFGACMLSPAVQL